MSDKRLTGEFCPDCGGVPCHCIERKHSACTNSHHAKYIADLESQLAAAQAERDHFESMWKQLLVELRETRAMHVQLLIEDRQKYEAQLSATSAALEWIANVERCDGDPPNHISTMRLMRQKAKEALANSEKPQGETR